MKEFRIYHSMKSSKSIQTSIGKIHIWHVEDYSMRIAAGEKKREIERSAVRLKLKQLGLADDLKYKETGQPFLENHESTFLSISHSNGVIAIYCANSPIGVDIEHSRPSLFEGRSYFVNPNEEKLELDQLTLQLIWGAKEAFYKQLEGQIDDLKNDVTICSVDMEKGIVQLEYDLKLVQLRFIVMEGLYLVYSD